MYDKFIASTVPWKSYKEEITTVVVEEGVTSIGIVCFYQLSALKNVSLPSTLTLIDGNAAGFGAFRECTALESIVLPEGLTTIGPMAFRECTSLKSITFPDSLTSLGSSAFQGCTNLTTVKYGTGLTSTGVNAFYEAGVRNIIFSPTITHIDGYSFYNCKMTKVEFPDTVTSIGIRSFANCFNLSSVTVNNPDTTFEGISIAEENPFYGEIQHVVFYGHSGSTTETFVAEHPDNDYEFVSLDSCSHANTQEVITKEPTCTETGTKNIVCVDCGFIKSTVEMPALGHTWELEQTIDETEENGHVYLNYTCSVCNAEKQEVEHIAFVEGFYDYSAPTCDGIITSGFETYKCTVEGCGKTERNWVSVKHSIDEYKVIAEPTCTEKGSQEGVCTVCGKTVTEEIPALGHQNTLKEEYDNFDDGHSYQVYTCSVCNAETVIPTHMDGVWVEGCYTSQEYTPSSCTTPGVRLDTCNICSERRFVQIEAKEHILVENTAARKEPTCTSDGTIFYVCEVCGKSVTETIPKLGHTFTVIESVEPTCTTAGYTTSKCSVCGYNDTVTYSKLDHTPDELNYTVISEQDCENDGLAKSVCTVCNQEFEIVLEAYGHNYEDVLTPIKDKPGHSLATPTCTRCGKEDTARTEHEEWIEGYYETTTLTEGSCTVARVTRDTCTICGEKSPLNTTPAPGHKYVYTGQDDSGRLTYVCTVCNGSAVPLSPSAVLALWNVRYANTAPYDTELGYRFELIDDGIINAKDYSRLVKLDKEAKQ